MGLVDTRTGNETASDFLHHRNLLYLAAFHLRFQSVVHVLQVDIGPRVLWILWQGRGRQGGPVPWAQRPGIVESQAVRFQHNGLIGAVVIAQQDCAVM